MTIRIGVIGLGMMGRHHARVAREIQGFELVAVADTMGDPHRVAGQVPCVENVEELIEHGIDAAIVAVPTGYHEKVGLQLAEAGVHALIEKPIADSCTAGERLVKAFESQNLTGTVGHIERFNPALMSLRSRLENGDLGEVYQIHTRRQGPFPSRIADVGAMKDLGSHDIDLTAWLAGSNFDRVAGQTTFRSGREHEDMVSVTAKLKNNTVTNHLVNWLTPFKERLTLVTGERGAFVADTLTADLTFYENGTHASEWDAVTSFRGMSEGTATRFQLEKREPLKAQHEAFRDRILGRSSEAVTLREGLQVLRVCEAILESAQTGEAVVVSAEAQCA